MVSHVAKAFQLGTQQNNDGGYKISEVLCEGNLLYVHESSRIVLVSLLVLFVSRCVRDCEF